MLLLFSADFFFKITFLKSVFRKHYENVKWFRFKSGTTYWQFWARGYKTFFCSTQLSTKFQLLIKTKIPTNEEVSCFKSLTCCIYHANKRHENFIKVSEKQSVLPPLQNMNKTGVPLKENVSMYPDIRAAMRENLSFGFLTK